LIFALVTWQFLTSTRLSFSNVFILKRSELRQLFSVSTLVGADSRSLRG